MCPALIQVSRSDLNVDLYGPNVESTHLELKIDGIKI